MDLEVLKDVMHIFMGVHKISIKHKKLMSFILFFTICIDSMLHLVNYFSAKPLITDLIIKQTFFLITPPGTPEFDSLVAGIKEDIKIFLGVEGILFLVNLITSLVLSTAIVLVAALLYGGKYVSSKDLLQRTIKSWKRPFVTWFYTTLFVIGYVILFLTILLPLLFIVDRPTLFKPISIALSILALIFYTHLSVVWTLAFILSVLEDRCGIEGLGKAAQILKGMKVKGFFLNLVFTIFSVISFYGLKLFSPYQSTFVQVSIGLTTVISSCLVRIIALMAYTIFHYKCKATHGEEVELQDSSSNSLEYVKVASTPFINENVA